MASSSPERGSSMTTTPSFANGVPCWVDLMTSDPAGARRFYGEVLGWTAEEPNPDFGGYANFLLRGEPIAGMIQEPGLQLRIIQG